MTRRTFDVVIVGGGVIGSAIACFLSANRGFGGTVAVVERDPLYAASSSSLSASSIRQQFGTAANIQMSQFGIRFLRDVAAQLGIEGEPAVDIGLREPGYLVLGRPADAASFAAKHAIQRTCDVAVELIGPETLAARHPWLCTDGLGIASFGVSDEGWFDGPSLAQAFRRKARAQGVKYVAAEVVAIERTAARVEGVVLEAGERIGCGTLVNAAGARAGALAALAGIVLPVVPRKRCVFVLDCPAELGPMPFVIDPSGFWLRPEGRHYLCGITPAEENADDDFGLAVDHALFEDRIWPALAARIPAFERLRLVRAWAGLYEFNTFDHSAILGPCPGLANLVFANGFSGHGMMHAPAAGQGVSELLIDGRATTVDLEPFAYERIATGRRIAEDVY